MMIGTSDILTPMRQAFAHQAVLTLAPDADTRAPGAAITAALRGDWEHPPPCPLAPHHTRADRLDDGVQLRILFAAEPDLEPTVRQRIELALSSGQLTGPDGTLTRWQLRTSGTQAVQPDETAHAERLRHS